MFAPDKQAESRQIGKIMTDYINFKTVKRPPKPNTCLAAPENHCLAAEPDFAPPVFELTGRGLFSKLSEIIAADRSWSKLVADPESLRLQFVATTGFMRFKDDVDIEIIPVDDTHTTLAIYSRSRIGYSDLGTNRKRVNDLIGRVTTN